MEKIADDFVRAKCTGYMNKHEYIEYIECYAGRSTQNKKKLTNTSMLTSVYCVVGTMCA